MTRNEKAEVIDYLTEEFKASAGIAICDYKSMTVSEMEDLRKKAREVGGKVKVVKNSLATIAFKNMDVEDLELKENNIFIWSEDQIAVAKLVVDYAKDNEKLVIKQGYMDGEIYDASGVEAVSKMPSKEELIGMLLSTWTAPLRNFAYVSTAVQRGYVTALSNYADTKSE